MPHPTPPTFMAPYPKINSIFKRDDRGRLVTDAYATPEIEYLSGLPWLWTEKVDGTNIRLGWDSGLRPATTIAYIAGRSDRAQIPPMLLRVLDELLTDRCDLFAEVFAEARWATLYGEGYGAGIHKGGLYRPDPGFVLFDVQLCTRDGMVWWLERPAVEDIAARLGIDVVPVVGEFTLHEACLRTDRGFLSQWPDATPEGLVGRPLCGLHDRAGRRILTKVKLRDWQDVSPPGAATVPGASFSAGEA